MKRYWQLYKRFNFYAVFGVSTFLLDVTLANFLIQNGFPDYPVIVGSFLMAVTLNFFLSYYFVFRGTEQTIKRGYSYFLGIALIGILVIGPGTILLQQIFGLPFYAARMIVGGLTGIGNFLLNNFLNFKMGLR